MESNRKQLGCAALVAGCGLLSFPAITYGQDVALREGARVRLLQRGDYRVVTLVHANADSVAYRPQDGSIEVVRTWSVSALEVSQGSRGHSGTGALIGGGVGLALGLLAVAAASSDSFLEPTAGEAFTAVFVLTGAGALLGAGIGAIIRTEEWASVPRPWETAGGGPEAQVRLVLSLPVGDSSDR